MEFIDPLAATPPLAPSERGVAKIFDFCLGECGIEREYTPSVTAYAVPPPSKREARVQSKLVDKLQFP